MTLDPNPPEYCGFTPYSSKIPTYQVAQRNAVRKSVLNATPTIKVTLLEKLVLHFGEIQMLFKNEKSNEILNEFMSKFFFKITGLKI